MSVMYLVMGVSKTLEVDTWPGRREVLNISDRAEGCVGYLLAFATRESAEKYAKPGMGIIPVETVEEDVALLSDEDLERRVFPFGKGRGGDKFDSEGNDTPHWKEYKRRVVARGGMIGNCPAAAMSALKEEAERKRNEKAIESTDLGEWLERRTGRGSAREPDRPMPRRDAESSRRRPKGKARTRANSR